MLKASSNFNSVNQVWSAFVKNCCCTADRCCVLFEEEGKKKNPDWKPIRLAQAPATIPQRVPVFCDSNSF